MAKHFDAVVIGAGQAGPSLAARLAAAGRRTAIVERLRFGGTCVNVGCIPTKTLVASAHAIHMARRGEEFGFASEGAVRADMARIKARKEAIVRESREGIESWLEGTTNLTVIRGRARFTAARTLAIDTTVGGKTIDGATDGETIEADQVFINVGGRAMLPAYASPGHPRCLTNSTILDLDAVPEHLIIIGGSYIGLEFAQVFRRFGSLVTVIERGNRLIPHEDEDISAGLKEVLEREGIAFRLGASVAEVQWHVDHVTVTVTEPEPGAQAQQKTTTVGSHVLFAVGRQPNTDDLGLDRAGVTTEERGFIVVDDQLRTNVEGVWALGECNGHGAFTHTAYNDYEIVAANLLGSGAGEAARRITDRIPCYALYTDPPVARAGMTLREAQASGKRLRIASRPMTRVSRAREMSETDGFMRAIVDAETDLILGAVIFGARGDEIVHSLLDAMYARTPYTTIARAVHIHPTITELIPTMLQEMP